MTRIKRIFLVLTMACSAWQINVLAKANPVAHPPYHLNPTSNHVSPSGLTPHQVRTAYGFAAFPLHGEGQVIGIIDAYDDPNIEQDLTIFNEAFSLPACTTANGCFEKIYARGTRPASNADWAMEISLDVEWAHTIAPGAKILLVEAADDSMDELAYAARVAVKAGATVVSMSFGAAEFAEEVDYDRTFNVRGISFVASAGDSGNGAMYPAASPYVVSVGGTTLVIKNSGQYVSETAWNGSGGGLSQYEKELWNQKVLPVPHDPTQKRAIPDVAYNADPNTGFSVYDSVPYDGQSGWYIVGGTSAGAPQWAALIALANSMVGYGLNINTVLYRIGYAASYNENFNDITTGSNGSCGFKCNAHTGYDYITGLGSPQMPTLVRTIYQYYLSKID